MRVWDLSPNLLCHKHLLGEHRELHGLWNILTIHQAKGGYSKHPETKRWVGKLAALYKRHSLLVKEVKNRGYNHRSSLNKKMALGREEQDLLLNSLSEQETILENKSCNCLLK